MATIELSVKNFDELTTRELYEILKLRISVFVVEQNCPYMELDNLDQEAIHLYFREEKGISAYLRILNKGLEREYVTIGRVIAVRRRCGIGGKLLDEGIRIAKERLGANRIYLEAQSYAGDFYKKHGFYPISSEFMLDGIPHIKMLADV